MYVYVCGRLGCGVVSGAASRQLNQVARLLLWGRYWGGVGGPRRLVAATEAGDAAAAAAERGLARRGR